MTKLVASVSFAAALLPARPIRQLANDPDQKHLLLTNGKTIVVMGVATKRCDDHRAICLHSLLLSLPFNNMSHNIYTRNERLSLGNCAHPGGCRHGN